MDSLRAEVIILIFFNGYRAWVISTIGG
jgi:hypothetical protein